MTHRLSKNKRTSLKDITPFDSTAEANGRYTYLNHNIVVEIPKGGYREGTAPDGTKWKNQMPAHYGYIEDTEGNDGEEVDIYVNDTPPDASLPVFILFQVDPETKEFDEHKLFLGYQNEQNVRAIYDQVFDNGSAPDRIGSISSIQYSDLNDWLNNPEDFEDDESPSENIESSEELVVDGTGDTTVPVTKVLPSHIKFLGLSKIGEAPYIVSEENPNGSLSTKVFILSPFSTVKWGEVGDYLIQLLYNSRPGDEVTMAISSPGGEVDLATRLASAMRATAALVKTISIGPVASAATLIWCEGHERYVTPGSYIMQHMSRHGALGNSFMVAFEGAALVMYLRDVIFKKAIDIGLLTQSEIHDMVVKDMELFLTPQDVSERTQATLLETW